MARIEDELARTIYDEMKLMAIEETREDGEEDSPEEYVEKHYLSFDDPKMQKFMSRVVAKITSRFSVWPRS